MKPVWDLPLTTAGLLVELDSGARVRVRPGRASDRAALLAAFEQFSDESRYMRFFSPRPSLTPRMVETFTEIDDVHQFAWAVFDPDTPSLVGDPSGLAIASARLFVDSGGDGVEATLAVIDAYQRKGLGRFLIELLVSTASIYNFDEVRFEVLHENHSMRTLLGKVGAKAHPVPEDRSVVDYRLAVPPEDEIDVPMGAVYGLLRLIEDHPPTAF
jgi:acetyltransferase